MPSNDDPRQIESVNPSSAVPGEAEGRGQHPQAHAVIRNAMLALSGALRDAGAYSDTLRRIHDGALEVVLGLRDAAPASPTGEAGGPRTPREAYEWAMTTDLRVVLAARCTRCSPDDECSHGICTRCPNGAGSGWADSIDGAAECEWCGGDGVTCSSDDAAPGEAREGERVLLWQPKHGGEWAVVPWEQVQDMIAGEKRHGAWITRWATLDPAPVSSEEAHDCGEIGPDGQPCRGCVVGEPTNADPAPAPSEED